MQTALRQRLRAEEAGASDALRRLEAHVAPRARGASEHGVGRGPRPAKALGAPAPARDLGRLADRGEPRGRLGPGTPSAGAGHGGNVDGSPDCGVDRQHPRSIADAALHDFKRVASEALPQGPELAAVESQVPFSVPP